MSAPSTEGGTGGSTSYEVHGTSLEATIHRVAHLLPIQGPIGVFVHHNTLHAFQHLPFHDALAAARRVFQARDYMTEAQYHAAYDRGRITHDDVVYALAFDRTQKYASEPPPSTVRLHRDVLLARTGLDVHDAAHAFMVRTAAAYLDMGAAYWTMPDRERGYYAAVVDLYTQRGEVEALLLRGMAQELTRQREAKLTALDVVEEALNTLGVGEDEREAYLSQLLLCLPGWAGMMHRLEQHPEDRPTGSPPASLVDYLAVRLTVECVVLRCGLRETGSDAASLSSLATSNMGEDERAAQLSAEADAVDRARSIALCPDMASLTARARRRVWHLAYEGFYRRQVLDAIAWSSKRRPEESNTPKLQALFCIDDREESFRRHLEEMDPDFLTYGLAGFFGLAIRYRGLDDGRYATLCPVVVTPAHVIEEVPTATGRAILEDRAKRRHLWARVLHLVHTTTRSVARGALLTPLLGALSAIPLILRVMFPRTAGLVKRLLATHTAPVVPSELVCDVDHDAQHESGLQLGFALDDQVRFVGAQLENIGLKKNFAPLALVIGHGSSSINNPHKSAYDCGACGGSKGSPNARLFAQLANKPEVRERLVQRGIEITDSTWFIGGYHDTASDAVALFDLDRVPASHQAHLIAAQAALDHARALDAHERCRRFESAPRRSTPESALRHVEARTEDLSQARPELGHCTVATCVVGRRALTRKLFFDRRAFLVSYDAHQDDNHGVLERILAAVGPVGAGISLEYYFSFVDNQRYGAGTKLPHNLTGLLGVMDGAGSDLRTGLPHQMIELHEPMRLLVIVEATPMALLTVAERQAEVRELVINGWIQLVSVDPDTGAVTVFNGAEFEPYTPGDAPLPHAPSSPAWYGDKHAFWDFLPPAVIDGPDSNARHNNTAQGHAHV